jgi:hypothetical protein
MNATQTISELPKVGDVWHPVYQTGTIGLHSHGLEFVWLKPEGEGWNGRVLAYAILCFSDGSNDDRIWHVSAVIHEDDMRYLMRWAVGELL